MWILDVFNNKNNLFKSKSTTFCYSKLNRNQGFQQKFFSKMVSGFSVEKMVLEYLAEDISLIIFFACGMKIEGIPNKS